jgi:hypothetical protein
MITKQAALTLALLLAAPLATAQPPPAPANSSSQPESLVDVVRQGKITLNVRLRYEHADQAGLRKSEALTIRPRLGFTTAAFRGLQAMFEVENITAFDADSYNQAGLNPGGAGRTVIADPEGTEVNQIWLSWKHDAAALKVGRQRVVLDNHRFVGDVGWRQNAQTFDAATVDTKLGARGAFFYGYVAQVNRIFGDRHAQGDFESDSHLLNISYSGWPAGKLVGYAYFLDFDNSRVNSSATYGLSLTGSRNLSQDGAPKITWRAEYAHQTDHGNQPLGYSTDYWMAELGAAWDKFNTGIAYELLGSDGGRKGFATPLATLHAFNGWADVFLVTPASGLRDAYGWVGAILPKKVAARAVYHDYESDHRGLDYGSEWDFQLARAFGKNWSTLLKYADYKGAGPFPDSKKFWVQVEFNF